jgi:hypothetical protein
MNKGDIYRWAYKNPPEHMPYHCRSQIAVFDGERLWDTFWQIGDSYGGGHSWTPEEAEQELQLTFLANHADLESYGPDAHHYYDPQDVVDLRHPNRRDRSLVYVRKGARRSAEKMRETLNYTIELTNTDIEVARRRIERCYELLERINNGDLDDVYVISYR